jgi:hypothetical protein
MTKGKSEAPLANSAATEIEQRDRVRPLRQGRLACCADLWESIAA